jgi:ribosomal protein S17E
MEKLIVLDEVTEVNSKSIKNKVYGRTGKKLDGNALAVAKCQRRNDVRRADRNPAAAR